MYMHVLITFVIEQVILCDECDRGYHSFCVGLEDIPSGKLCLLYHLQPVCYVNMFNNYSAPCLLGYVSFVKLYTPSSSKAPL